MVGVPAGTEMHIKEIKALWLKKLHGYYKLITLNIKKPFSGYSKDTRYKQPAQGQQALSEHSPSEPETFTLMPPR